MAERDKIEPFWARRAKRRGPPPLVVPERPPAEPATAPEPPNAAAPDQPREPSFVVTAAARPVPNLGRAPAAPSPDMRGWVQLAPAEAARERLFGVQGWLVVLAIFVALGLFRALVELVDFWATTDHGGLSAWIMAVLRSGMALWAALILGLLLGRSRAFPTNFVAYGLIDSIYLVLFGLAFAHVTHGAVFTGVAVAIGLNLVAVAYVLHARRVNVTYRHRVRAKRHAPAAPPTRGVEASAA